MDINMCNNHCSVISKMYLVDEVSGSVNLKFGDNIITLNHADLLKVLERKSDDLFLSCGKKLHVYDEDEYCFTRYRQDRTIKSCISLTQEEFYKVLDLATDITHPAVHDEICTLCDSYVVNGDVHFGCPCNCKKMELFSSLKFGNGLIRIMTELVCDRYKNDMDFAYASVKRSEVCDRININDNILCKMGPVSFNNENILRYDSYFRNFKLCAKPIVERNVYTILNE